MIESALAFGNMPQPTSKDPGFLHWEKTGASTAQRHRPASMRYDVNERTAGPMPVFGQLLSKNNMALSQASGSNINSLTDSSANTSDKPEIAYETLPSEDAYSFGDVIDMVNPFHHLPVIGMFYRKFSGDTIKPFASIIGGTIFGGPVGAVSSTVNAIIKDRTGKDVAENAFSMAGIDMTPAKPAKEELVYLAPKEPETKNTASQKHMFDAIYSITHLGQRNFSSGAMSAYKAAEDSSKNSSAQRWNA